VYNAFVTFSVKLDKLCTIVFSSLQSYTLQDSITLTRAQTSAEACV